jgi:hypothetical protein
VFENIGIDEITPLHEARNPRLVDDLVADMRENGWQGIPLLVIEREHDYLAWTGSHRIAAARKAEFLSIPCYVIQEQDLLSLGFDAEYGHVQDYERLAIIRKLGDETALNIMWQEGRI